MPLSKAQECIYFINSILLLLSLRMISYSFKSCFPFWDTYRLLKKLNGSCWFVWLLVDNDCRNCLWKPTTIFQNTKKALHKVTKVNKVHGHSNSVKEPLLIFGEFNYKPFQKKPGFSTFFHFTLMSNQKETKLWFIAFRGYYHTSVNAATSHLESIDGPDQIPNPRGITSRHWVSAWKSRW